MGTVTVTFTKLIFERNYSQTWVLTVVPRTPINLIAIGNPLVWDLFLWITLSPPASPANAHEHGYQIHQYPPGYVMPDEATGVDPLITSHLVNGSSHNESTAEPTAPCIQHSTKQPH